MTKLLESPLVRQRYYRPTGLGLAVCLLALLQISATIPAQQIDAQQADLSAELCGQAAIEFNHATSDLPHDPDAAYFGKRCRFGYPQECLRWCYAMQRINARFYAARRKYEARCPGPAVDTAVDSLEDEVAAITGACAELDLNAIQGILLARWRQEPR